MTGYKIGDTIEIISMDGEPQYTHKHGVIEYIDDMGQLHGTWGGIAIHPALDNFRVLDDSEVKS